MVMIAEIFTVAWLAVAVVFCLKVHDYKKIRDVMLEEYNRGYEDGKREAITE